MPKQQGQEINAARLHPPYGAQPRTKACANLLVAPFEHFRLDYSFLSLAQRTAML